MRPTVSLIIPAYNEANRLPSYLGEVRDYFDQSGIGYEVFVVDDGSSDETANVVAAAAEAWAQLRLIRLPENRGKGAAVRTGMLAAGGDYLLFADADGATPIAEEEGLRRRLHDGYDVVAGSRLMPGSVADRGLRRRASGWVFAAIVRSLFRLPVCDTQCGFKMVRREVQADLFDNCRERGYLLDIELLARAVALGYSVTEVPVRWNDVAGSKVRLVRDSVRMVTGLVALRLRLAFASNSMPVPRPASAAATLTTPQKSATR